MALSLSPAARENIKDILVCFSLGNLCFVRRWYDLEVLQDTGLDYLRPAPANSVLLFSTLIAGVLLGAIFWIAWQWARRRAGLWVRIAHGGFLLVMAFPLESVRRYWNAQFGHTDLASNAALLSI